MQIGGSNPSWGTKIIYALVAQLKERPATNREVGSLNLFGGTKYARVVEWSKASDCKSEIIHRRFESCHVLENKEYRYGKRGKTIS